MDHVTITVADAGRGTSRQLLRSCRGPARHGAESSSATAVPDGDGAARVVRRRRDSQQEDRRAARSAADRPPRRACFAARGQYGAGWVEGQHVPAYRDEPDVAPRLDDGNLRGGETVRGQLALAGRALLPAHRETLAADRLRSVDLLSCGAASGVSRRGHDDWQPARLAICIQPEQGIVLRFQAKQPGTQMLLRPVDMHFSYHEPSKCNRPTHTRPCCGM